MLPLRCQFERGFAEHLRDHVTDGGVLYQVDGFAAETTSLGETFINHVADDDRGGCHLIIAAEIRPISDAAPQIDDAA